MNYRKKELEPNLTPLIDVVFLLLIFFMVATTFQNTGGLKIELPKSQLSKIEEVPEKISVLIAKDGEMKLKIEKKSDTRVEDVTKENIKEMLEKELSLMNDKRVSIQGDQGIEYGEVVKIMGEIKSAGAHAIDIEAEKER
jgi:biopolymer transport protein ExbD